MYFALFGQQVLPGGIGKFLTAIFNEPGEP
jgi:hypothetical protein